MSIPAKTHRTILPYEIYLKSKIWFTGKGWVGGGGSLVVHGNKRLRSTVHYNIVLVGGKVFAYLLGVCRVNFNPYKILFLFHRTQNSEPHEFGPANLASFSSWSRIEIDMLSNSIYPLRLTSLSTNVLFAWPSLVTKPTAMCPGNCLVFDLPTVTQLTDFLSFLKQCLLSLARLKHRARRPVLASTSTLHFCLWHCEPKPSRREGTTGLYYAMHYAYA
jgi:hypothetical protein